MSGGSSEQTIGYKYFLGVQMALAHGPLDTITRIEVDRRIAWEGVNSGTSITIDAEELFGGEEREGGVSGTVDIDMGLPAQTANSYLQSVLGNDVPAYRGVACAVLNQCYMGNNPYLKPWAFRAQRIFLTSDGEAQWYSEKAGTSTDCTSGCACDIFATETAGDVDHFWPMDASVNTGVGRTGDQFLATVGTDMDHNSSGLPYEDFREDPSVEEPCGDSWWLKPSGAGQYGAIFDLSTSLASSGGMSMGFSTNQVDWGAPTREVSFFAATVTTNIGDYSIYNEFTITDVGQAEKMLYLGNSNATHSDTVAISGFGLDIDVPNWYHWSITFSVRTGFIDYILTAWVNGEQVNTFSYSQGVNPGVTTVRFQNVEFQAHSDENDGYSRWGYLRETTAGAPTQAMIDAWNCGTAADCGNCSDMNPAHIVRECLTDTNWGMGYNATDIDDTSFTAAADTLFTEGMGMSLEWHTEMPLEEFVAEVLRHCDAVLFVDRTNGKFVLNLIRDDYQNDSTLVVLSEDNVAGISDAKRPTTGELTSSVTVNFWNRDTGETASVTEHNWPLIQIQGAQTHTTIQYPGFTNYVIAQQVALRDLSSLSTPLLSCRIEASREAAELNVGDAFILDWPDLDIDSLVMRVQQLTLGDNRDNTIVIDALEDSFSLPVARSEAPEDGIWVDPITGTPLDSVPRIVTEAPYYEIVRTNGEINTNDILSANNGAGFILVAGGRQSSEINANLHIDDGTGYTKGGRLEFSPYAYLVAPITETDTQIYITGGKDLDLAEVGNIAQIGNELVRIDEISSDSNGDYVVVGRGILDTVPATHGLDSNTLDSNHTNLEDSIIFWDQDAASDNIEYSASESISAKIQTVLGSTTQTIADVPSDSVTFNTRAFRPYPAGNLQIDGEGYPEANTSTEIYYNSAHLISWAYRDRLQQTDGNLYDYTTGDIGPEAGTTYRIDIYSTLQDGTTTDPWWTLDAGQVNSYQMDSSSPDSSRGDPPAETELVHIKVTSVRDGYDSYQSPVATLSYISDSTA